MRGDIKNSPYANRAKEYAWNLCQRYAPPNISPTDIDYMTERRQKFIFFEMKTLGTQMDTGQRIALEELLRQLGKRAVLFIVEHPPLDYVVMPNDVTRFSIWSCWNGEFHCYGPIPGAWFGAAYQGFFTWAEKNDPAALKTIAREAANGKWSLSNGNYTH